MKPLKNSSPHTKNISNGFLSLLKRSIGSRVVLATVLRLFFSRIVVFAAIFADVMIKTGREEEAEQLVYRRDGSVGQPSTSTLRKRYMLIFSRISNVAFFPFIPADQSARHHT